MANNRQRRYRTYGNVAYQADFNGSAVRVPQREERQQGRPQPRPQVQPRRKPIERPRIQVREAGSFAPFTAVGLACVAVFAILLLVANAQLMMINDQTVALRSQLKTLQTEQASLMAQYELAFDLDQIEAELTANGSMVKLQPGQMTYLDVSEPDSAVLFDQVGQGLEGIFHECQRFFTSLLP